MSLMNRYLLLIACALLALGFTIQQGKPIGTTVEAKEQEFKTITVQKGDTLYRLAKKYHISVKAIAQLNHISDPAKIRVGQVLKIKASTKSVAEIEAKTTDVMSSSNQPVAIPASSFPVMSRGKFLGEFTVTAYTAGPESTGKRPGEAGYGITSSGARVIDGLTIAVDPNVIPIGSRVYIEGIGYRTAVDTGSAIKGKRIDLFMNDLTEARAFGVKKNVRVELVSD